MSLPLYLVVLAPLVAALLLLLGRRMPRRLVSSLALGGVGLSLVTLTTTLPDLTQGGSVRTQLWTWIDLAQFHAEIALSLDALSGAVAVVVATVSLLVFAYASEHMEEEEDLARFFGQLSLFVAAMLLIVTADDLLLLYLGWEGVGLCSFLLIGFWYREPENLKAAKKAFVVTRFGDTALALGLLLLAIELGTTDLSTITAATLSESQASRAAGLLLVGALAKSAQLPFSMWLPDAMAGPTPVSALMHAATMVTAGVFLVARLHPLFVQAPVVLEVTTWVGAITLLYGALSALGQRDIKRVLAYSTISQLGFMFLTLGVGAYSAAIFHLCTHAFFKALLFLVAGVVIRATGRHDLDELGGLREALPRTYAFAVVGGLALAGLPLVTAGAFSKEAILLRAWLAPTNGKWLGPIVLIGTALTGLYVVRWLWLIFHRPADVTVGDRPRPRAVGSMGLLALGSVLIGYLHAPVLGLDPWSPWIRPVIAGIPDPVSHDAEMTMAFAGGLAALIGLGLAALLHRRRPEAARSPLLSRGSEIVFHRGFGLDAIYDGLAGGLRRLTSDRDPIDAPFRGLASLVNRLARALSRGDEGRLRHYAYGVALGAILLSTLGVML